VRVRETSLVEMALLQQEVDPSAFGGIMSDFPHRDLDVYKLAMHAVTLVVAITNAIPARDSWLAKQLRRGVGSIVLNLGEGCGEHSPLEKARIIRIARRSAYETADGVRLVPQYARANAVAIDEADAVLGRVSAMLTKLALRFEKEGVEKQIERRRISRARARDRARERPLKTSNDDGL
jgi:four helix bundle protein